MTQRKVYTPVRTVGELQKGQSIITPGRTIFESSITAFCGVVGDSNPLHLNVLHAAQEPIGRIIAPAPMLLSIAIGLWGETRWLQAILLPFVGLSDWRLEKAVFPGDTIWSKVTIQDLKPTSKGDRFLMDLFFEVFAHRADMTEPASQQQEGGANGNGTRVMYFTTRFLVGDQDVTVM
jgi:acyl dehydratase